MTPQQQALISSEVFYPASDGKPVADNTKQFRWIVVIEQNLEWLFADEPNVFVAGDLLWYPIKGNNTVCTARKLLFYDRYGVEEYYIYDPDRIELSGWHRSDTGLDSIEEMNGWISPRLGIRFNLAEELEL